MFESVWTISSGQTRICSWIWCWLLCKFANRIFIIIWSFWYIDRSFILSNIWFEHLKRSKCEFFLLQFHFNKLFDKFHPLQRHYILRYKAPLQHNNWTFSTRKWVIHFQSNRLFHLMPWHLTPSISTFRNVQLEKLLHRLLNDLQFNLKLQHTLDCAKKKKTKQIESRKMKTEFPKLPGKIAAAWMWARANQQKCSLINSVHIQLIVLYRYTMCKVLLFCFLFFLFFQITVHKICCITVTRVTALFSLRIALAHSHIHHHHSYTECTKQWQQQPVSMHRQ